MHYYIYCLLFACPHGPNNPTFPSTDAVKPKLKAPRGGAATPECSRAVESRASLRSSASNTTHNAPWSFPGQSRSRSLPSTILTPGPTNAEPRVHRTAAVSGASHCERAPPPGLQGTSRRSTSSRRRRTREIPSRRAPSRRSRVRRLDTRSKPPRKEAIRCPPVAPKAQVSGAAQRAAESDVERASVGVPWLRPW